MSKWNYSHRNCCILMHLLFLIDNVIIMSFISLFAVQGLWHLVTFHSFHATVNETAWLPCNISWIVQKTFLSKKKRQKHRQKPFPSSVFLPRSCFKVWHPYWGHYFSGLDACCWLHHQQDPECPGVQCFLRNFHTSGKALMDAEGVLHGKRSLLCPVLILGISAPSCVFKCLARTLLPHPTSLASKKPTLSYCWQRQCC